ncbi:MAG: DUF268 domain-containing protein [Spirochaetia bacterium]|nr:DUF268 domain-containing protein [Spirochaetia bacterium]
MKKIILKYINYFPFSSIFLARLQGLIKFVQLPVDVIKAFRDYRLLKKSFSKSEHRFSLSFRTGEFYLTDKTSNTLFDAHYIYHPAWAARALKKINPTKHIDISSTLHFCSIVSSFIPVEFYDYRPAQLKLSDLTSKHADLLKLPFKDNSVKSLSCMHTVEHVGLGRYGDKIDYDGDLKAIEELKRVLAQNGDLLFVVPLGKPKLVFNAHRIYSYDQIINYFNGFSLKEFALIPDFSNGGGIIKNASKKLVDNQKWGCGCFWFRKEKPNKR